MSRVEFRIIKNRKDIGRLAGINCSETISVDWLEDLLARYPASAGYELMLDKVVGQIIIGEKDNGEH